MLVSIPQPTNAPFFKALEEQKRHLLWLCHLNDVRFATSTGRTITLPPLKSEFAPLLDVFTLLASIRFSTHIEGVLHQKVGLVLSPFISKVVSSFVTSQITALLREKISPWLNQLDHRLSREMWLGRESERLTLAAQASELLCDVDCVKTDKDEFVGIPLELFPEDDELQDEWAYQQQFRQSKRFDLFIKEDEIRKEKTKLFLDGAKSISSPHQKLLLLAGVIAIAALHVLTGALNIYLLSNFSFTLRGVAALVVQMAAAYFGNFADRQIKVQVGLVNLMELQECRKTALLHLQIAGAWQARWTNYSAQLNETLSELTTVDRKVADLAEEIGQFDEEMGKLGWIGSPLFTLSDRHVFWGELLFPDKTPLPLPNF